MRPERDDPTAYLALGTNRPTCRPMRTMGGCGTRRTASTSILSTETGSGISCATGALRRTSAGTRTITALSRSTVSGRWTQATRVAWAGDTGARSTFLMIAVSHDVVTLNVYRDDANSSAYTWMHREQLAAGEMAYGAYLPVLQAGKPLPPINEGD